MPLFVCDKCKVVENTACGHYWTRGQDFYKDKKLDKMALCSQCMPTEFNDGSRMKSPAKWHGRFERRIATKELIKEWGEDNFVYVSDIKGVKARNVGA